MCPNVCARCHKCITLSILVAQCVQAMGNICVLSAVLMRVAFMCMCVHIGEWRYSHCLKVKWQVRGGCSSNNQRVRERGGKEETEMGSAAVGLGRGKIGRRVMIGWYRTEERMRGVQRGWKKEERNERRAREWLQMGWDWQRRDGSLERRRE